MLYFSVLYADAGERRQQQQISQNGRDHGEAREGPEPDDRAYLGKTQHEESEGQYDRGHEQGAAGPVSGNFQRVFDASAPGRLQNMHGVVDDQAQDYSGNRCRRHIQWNAR